MFICSIELMQTSMDVVLMQNIINFVDYVKAETGFNGSVPSQIFGKKDR